MGAQGRTKVNPKSINGKKVGKGASSLFGRVGNTKPVQHAQLKKQQPSGKHDKKTGLTFVGGKLVLAAELRSQPKGSRGSSDEVQRKRQPSSGKAARNNAGKKSMTLKQQGYKEQNNRSKKLVISLKEDIKCLKIRNLPVGANPSNLLRVLQQMGNCSISDLKLIDLPSGSAQAEVFAAVQHLETLHQRFNHAEIDGRRVLTEISSQPEL